VRYDVAVVGGGTAGCVIAARLSEDPARTVCLIEAGPDYGPLAAGGWPADLLDPRALTFTHDWGTGGEDARSLGARVVGGSSAHNACMAVVGTPDDYDEWGDSWAWARFAPYLARAREMLRVGPTNTLDPAPLHVAFLEAAACLSLPFLDDLDDQAHPVGAGRLPGNVVEDTRWSTAFAYLDSARSRPNLQCSATPSSTASRWTARG
jgi:choline dehydrogenase